jgi:hypothetical protein
VGGQYVVIIESGSGFIDPVRSINGREYLGQLSNY